MPYGQFYALAIFIMDRLDTKGVGLKPWGRQRACSQDYPMALDPLLQWEQKPVHDFLFPFSVFKCQDNYDLCFSPDKPMNAMNPREISTVPILDFGAKVIYKPKHTHKWQENISVCVGM